MVVVKLLKVTLVWNEAEFIAFMQSNPEFFTRGIKNGKHYLRGIANEQRQERGYGFYRNYRNG